MTIIQANKFYFMRGGAERYAFDLSAWLSNRGQRVVPFAMQHSDNLSTPYARFFPTFVPTEQVRFNWDGLRTVGRMLYSLEARRCLASLVAETGPDLCHIHNIYTQLSPSILHTLRIMKVPTVMTVHDHHLISPQYGSWVPGCGPQLSGHAIPDVLSRFHKGSLAASFLQVLAFRFHRAMRIYERGIDLFICPSEYLAHRLIAAGFPKSKVRVNHYGIDPTTTEPVYGHRGYVLFVGRLSPEKGVETILDIARVLTHVSFRIVGTGPEEAALHATGHALHNVTFVGFRDGEALREEYRGAMAIVLPSRVQEVFPLVALEAMAYGVPVVASAVGGVPEVVQDRRTGWLVAPLNIPGWVEAITRLSTDEPYRLTLARAARGSVETTFHIRHHHERLLAAYAEVTGKSWT